MESESVPWGWVLVFASVLTLLFLLVFNRKRESESVNNSRELETTHSSSPKPVAEDDELHLVPDLFGKGAVSDGRTYSIALLASSRMPSHTKLVAQGVLRARSTGAELPIYSIWLADEQMPDKTLICYMSEGEFSESAYLDRIGTTVQVMGEYVSRDAYGLDFVHCSVARSTDKVVRPLSSAFTVVEDATNSLEAKSATSSASTASSPKAVFTPDAEYTDEARQAKVQGTCKLELLVGTDGRTRDIHVIDPLGHGLDEKAIETVKQWRFEPATKDGKPVEARITAEMNFRLY